MSVTFKKSKVLKETEKALRIFSKDFQEVCLSNIQWVPKSAIHDDSEVYSFGHSGDLVKTAYENEE